jgi:CBS domain-containing protein
MQVSEAMTRDVRVAHPNQSIAEVARIMARIDAGFMPVGENDQLVGIITDRDIAIRAVAADKDHYTAVRQVMTREVKYCFEDDDIEQVARNMSEQRVRRLPVLNRAKRLVGVLSLSDLALLEPDAATQALCGISQPGGLHSQTAVVHGREAPAARSRRAHSGISSVHRG